MGGGQLFDSSYPMKYQDHNNFCCCCYIYSFCGRREGGDVCVCVCDWGQDGGVVNRYLMPSQPQRVSQRETIHQVTGRNLIFCT